MHRHVAMGFYRSFGFGPILQLGHSVGGTVIVLNQAALNIPVEETVGLLLWKPPILNPIAPKP